MKKRMFALLLTAVLLTGCGRIAAPDVTEPTNPLSGVTEPTQPPVVTVPEETYIHHDLLAGESPVPNRRVGLDRQGLSSVDSGTGTYFLYRTSWILDVTPPSPWILYMDHGSDTVIKLCGRPDCPHDTRDCNAFVEEGEFLSFYNGYLYIFSCPSVSSDNGRTWEDHCKLLRMDPDGFNRTEVYDFTAFAKEQGADFAKCELVSEGYCIVSTNNYVLDDRYQTTSEQQACYAYRLDGSMEQPQKINPRGWNLCNCGDVLLTWTPASEQGGQYGSYYDYDIATDTLTFLTDHPGTPGYYDETAGYYFKDGCLHRLTYASGSDKVLLKTDLTGDYNVLFFPDCFVLADGETNSENPDMNLYIYNWAFELVDTIKCDFPCDVFMVSDLIIGENPRQIILSNGEIMPNAMPMYYIDKAELGTGNAQIHKYKQPDLEYYQYQQQEEQEDKQWFDEN